MDNIKDGIKEIIVNDLHGRGVSISNVAAGTIVDKIIGKFQIQELPKIKLFGYDSFLFKNSRLYLELLLGYYNNGNPSAFLCTFNYSDNTKKWAGQDICLNCRGANILKEDVVKAFRELCTVHQIDYDNVDDIDSIIHHYLNILSYHNSSRFVAQ